MRPAIETKNQASQLRLKRTPREYQEEQNPSTFYSKKRQIVNKTKTKTKTKSKQQHTTTPNNYSNPTSQQAS
jgi:hypothetical protein